MGFGPVAGYATLVGSREITDYQYRLMQLAGEMTCLRGRRGRSGLAIGADTAAYEGARWASRFNDIGFDNYLPDAGMFNNERFGFRTPDPENHIWDSMSFTDTYDQARQIAYDTRKGFHGLYENGIRLHTRNVYQVLGHGLDRPSDYLICVAEPKGRSAVRGGTNTAFRLALARGIPVRNLWHTPVQASLLKNAKSIADQLSPNNQSNLEWCLSQAVL